MLVVEIGGLDSFELEHLVLDVNGTVALDGVPLPGVADAVRELSSVLRVWAITADTCGTARDLADQLDVELRLISPGEESAQKAAFLDELGPSKVIAIGNGANDDLMLRSAAIGIAVLGAEGLACEALQAADLVVCDITAALGLLLEPKRLVATLRR